MKFGVTMFTTDYSISPSELAVAAEERDFESLWLPEHSHIPIPRVSPWPGGGELPKMYYDVMDPFVSLASAASVTKKIKLATGICLVVQRDPIQVAKEIATLDQISKGRFLFGVGGGWNAEEMANHGTTDFKNRFKLLDERLQAMRAIWTESKPKFNGDYVKFRILNDLVLFSTSLMIYLIVYKETEGEKKKEEEEKKKRRRRKRKTLSKRKTSVVSLLKIVADMG